MGRTCRFSPEIPSEPGSWECGWFPGINLSWRGQLLGLRPHLHSAPRQAASLPMPTACKEPSACPCFLFSVWCVLQSFLPTSSRSLSAVLIPSCLCLTSFPLVSVSQPGTARGQVTGWAHGNSGMCWFTCSDSTHTETSAHTCTTLRQVCQYLLTNGTRG